MEARSVYININGSNPSLFGASRWTVNIPENKLEDDKQLEFQKAVAKKLSRFDVTEERLRQCPWFSEEYQERTLAFLLIVKNIPLERALDELKDLSYEESTAIRNGFTREDANLQEYEFKTLIALKEWGLTRQHLDKLEYFSKAHARALIHLIKEEYLSADDAIEEIRGINQTHAKLRLKTLMRLCNQGRSWVTSKNIVNDLDEQQLKYFLNHRQSVENVRDLTELQLMALENFPNVRSINQIIKTEVWVNTIRNSHNFSNLSNLFNSGMDFIKALQSLSGLNEIQSSVFVRLRRSGVTAEQLREDPAFNSVEHIEALDRLLEQGYTAHDALDRIKGKTPEEVATLGQSKINCLVM